MTNCKVWGPKKSVCVGLHKKLYFTCLSRNGVPRKTVSHSLCQVFADYSISFPSLQTWGDRDPLMTVQSWCSLVGFQIQVNVIWVCIYSTWKLCTEPHFFYICEVPKPPTKPLWCSRNLYFLQSWISQCCIVGTTTEYVVQESFLFNGKKQILTLRMIIGHVKAIIPQPWAAKITSKYLFETRHLSQGLFDVSAQELFEYLKITNHPQFTVSLYTAQNHNKL